MREGTNLPGTAPRQSAKGTNVEWISLRGLSGGRNQDVQDVRARRTCHDDVQYVSRFGGRTRRPPLLECDAKFLRPQRFRTLSANGRNTVCVELRRDVHFVAVDVRHSRSLAMYLAVGQGLAKFAHSPRRRTRMLECHGTSLSMDVKGVPSDLFHRRSDPQVADPDGRAVVLQAEVALEQTVL